MSYGELKALEQAIGLHENLEVSYVVDGYVAKLVDEQGKTIAERQSETLFDALIDLSNAVKGAS